MKATYSLDALIKTITAAKTTTTPAAIVLIPSFDDGLIVVNRQTTAEIKKPMHPAITNAIPAALFNLYHNSGELMLAAVRKPYVALGGINPAQSGIPTKQIRMGIAKEAMILIICNTTYKCVVYCCLR